MVVRLSGCSLVASLLLACSASTGPSGPTAAQPAAATAATPPRAQTAQSSGASQPEDLTPLPSPFREAGEVPLELSVLEDGRLVGQSLVSNPDQPMETTYKLFVLTGDRFERVHSFTGSAMFGPIVDRIVAGPEGAIDLLVLNPGARTAHTNVLTAVGRPVKNPPVYAGSWGGMTLWDKSSFALVYGVLFNDLVVVRGPDPMLLRTMDQNDCNGFGTDKPKVWAMSLVATDSALFAVGDACKDNRGIEVWKRGEKTSTVFLEDASAELVRRGTDLYLTGKAPKRWNGTSFEAAASVPPEAPVTTSDGRKWKIESTTKDGRFAYRLFALDGDKKRDVTLPQPDPQLLAQGGTLWVSTSDGKLHRLDDGKPAPKIAVNDRDVRRPDAKARPRFLAGGPSCRNNVVVLYGFTKVTPDDYDFPLTRKALKGRTELASVKFAVTRDGGQKFFVGLTPSFDLAKKLRDRIEKEVKGSKPQIVCAEPEVVRELPLDLASGEVRK
jgi:hypothetical protein